MKISNKNKDRLLIIGIMFMLIWLLSGLVFWISTLFAEPINTEKSAINKAYAEETIVLEMQYAKMWEYTEGMSQKEYADTFFRG